MVVEFNRNLLYPNVCPKIDRLTKVRTLIKMKNAVFFGVFLLVTLAKAEEPSCLNLPSNQDVLFASTASCNQYYMCREGVLSEEKCTEGLYFSENYNGCVEAQHAECLMARETPPTTTEPPITETPTEPPTTEPATETPITEPPTTEPPTTEPPTTEPPTTEPPTTTSGEVTPTSTPEVTISTSPGTTPPTIDTTTPGTGTTPGTVCPNDNTAYFPHPTECHLFVECWGGNAYDMACPPNYYYSESRTKCVIASESECCIADESKCT